MTYFDGISSHHLVHKVGNGRDFVAYNVGSFPMTDEPVDDSDIVTGKFNEWTAVLARCRNETWSSYCQWFMVLQAEGIYLLNVHDNSFFLCRKHSHDFINHFLKAK